MQSFKIVCFFVAAALLTWSCPASAVDCFVDPTDPACADYRFDPVEVSSNITSICDAVPETIGCFVRQMCANATSLFSQDAKCSSLAIFLLICRDGSSFKYCNGYNALCATGSVVPECSTPFIDAPENPSMNIAELCTNQSSALPGSVGCQETYDFSQSYIIPNSDVFMGYSKICAVDDNSTLQCQSWRNLCALPNKTNADYAGWPFCDPFAANPLTCLDRPSSAACVDYSLTTVESDISNLCHMMINMPGCSLDTMCRSNATLNSTSPYCMDRFSILKVICLDMPGMSGCNKYKQMCAAGTQVSQCTTAVPDMPMTMYLSNTAITPLCAGTTGTLGDACTSCVAAKSTCDLFGVYSAVCYGSSNTMCAKYTAACASPGLSEFPWCNTPVLMNAPPAVAPAVMDVAPVMPPSSAAEVLASFAVIVAITFVAMLM